MAGAAVSYALRKLDVIVSMGFRLYNLNDEVALMRLDLRMIEGFLRDAYSNHNRNPGVNQWVKEVRDVAYRIEDAIGTFLVDIEGNSQRSKLVRLIKKPLKLKRLAEKVKAINQTLEMVGTRRNNLGITTSGDGCEENDLVPFRPTRLSDIDDSEVVGLDSDKSKIIEHLLDESKSKRTVLSIVGIGGLGKTTLAQKVYKSAELAGKFQCCIWMSISQQYNLNIVLRKILNSIEPNKQHKKSTIEDDNLIDQLKRSLTARRYFIVLDDVWTKDLWEHMKMALPDNNNASRVLITSRFLNVAKAADVGTEPYQLPYLNDSESLTLFLKKAFQNREPWRSYSDQPACPAHLNDVAKQLTKKCGGLPLALIVLGGILSTREPTYSAWQRVNEILDWHNDEAKRCSQVLALSYLDLPYDLKPCFLYFASFPENYQISTKHVIRMWVAEGFLPKDGIGTMEDRAEEFFEQLVQRCLVQVIRKSWNGNCKNCRMHGLLRDIAIREAKEENFFNVVSKPDDGSQMAVEDVRRASLQYTMNFGMHSTNIRSLICFGHYLPNYRGFRLLRVLTIERVAMSDKRSIHKGWLEGLIHLRYLGFRYCDMPEGFERISFGYLTNLETIDLKGTEICPVPFNKINSPLYIWDAPTLRHVIIDLMIIYPLFPSKWDQLKNMQTLKWVRLEDIPQLEYNINLRTIGIHNWEQYGSVEHAWQALKNLLIRTEYLVSLAVKVAYKNLVPFLTEGTSGLPCHEKIQCLYLEGKWAKNVSIRTPMMLPTNLTKLTLNRSSLVEDPMPALERLQCLRILRLWEDSFEGKTLTCTKEGFPSLQKLELKQLSNLSRWHIKSGAMPVLSHLKIIGCSQLRVLPKLQRVRTLQDLTLDWVLHIKAQGDDRHKIKHIPSVRGW